MNTRITLTRQFRSRANMRDSATSSPGKRLVGPFPMLVTVLAAGSLNADAAEWTVTPDVRFTGTYNDNIILAVDPVDTVYGAILDVSARLRMRTERSELAFTPLLRFSRYDGEEGLDSDDQHFRLTGSHAATERLNAAFDARFVRNTTLNSELLETGRVIAGIRRERIDLRPSFDYALTERDVLRFGYTYANVNYDADPITTDLFDYDYHAADMTGIHRLGVRDAVSARFHVSRFEAPDFANETNTFGFMGQYEHAFSETLSGALALGVATSDIDISGPGRQPVDDSTDPMWDVRLNKRFEYTDAEIRLRRALLPTGGGDLVRRDQLDLGLERRFGPLTDGSIRITGFRNEDLEDRDGSGTREVLRVLARFSRRLGKRWSLSGEYRFFLSDTDTRDAATSNAVFVVLRYSGTQWMW